MPERKLRPPESDSDSDADYEGFYFGDSFKRDKNYFQRPEPENKEQVLREASESGDLDVIRAEMESLIFDVDLPIRSDSTLLMNACRFGHWEVVAFLLNEKGANPNKQIDSVTPLMEACGCSAAPKAVVDKIVALLLQHGAVVNVSDKYGTTPFMSACKHGHTGVVRRLVKDAALNAADNQGCTSLFHAVEKNEAEIVRLLVEAGADTSVPNRKGYTPVQVAEFHGFYDLLDILPKDKPSAYLLPSKYLGYATLRDYIPRIFLKADGPEYFPEIYKVLVKSDLQPMVEYFAKAQVPFKDFLCMNDARLEEIGIAFPFHRQKILKALLDFHLHHWSKRTIAMGKQSRESFYDLLLVNANHLQHLVVLKSTLRYVQQNVSNGICGQISKDLVVSMRRTLVNYEAVLKDVIKATKKLNSYSPLRNPLYIDYDEFLAERKRGKVKKYVKYTTIILGFTVFVCLKAKNYF